MRRFAVSPPASRVMSWMVVSVVVSVVVGCSSDDAEPVTTGRLTTTAAESVTTEPGESDAVPTSAAGGTLRGHAVVVDVSVGRLELSEQLEVSIEPDGFDEIDPFTRFGSCSGLRASVGTFGVAAVDDTASVRAVSVVTVDRVTGPGIYDADIRVETTADGTVSAAGTVTLDPGLRSGSFQAFEPTGESVSGTFACDGPAGTAVPLGDVEGAADDGVLQTVEVVALLRRGGEERIVGLALDTAEVASAEADCPGVTGGDGPTVVRVEGGPDLGAITTFELTPERSPTMHMRVGGVTYDVVDADLDVDESGGSGTFSGQTVDGIAIDGAFRCA